MIILWYLYLKLLKNNLWIIDIAKIALILNIKSILSFQKSLFSRF